MSSLPSSSSSSSSPSQSHSHDECCASTAAASSSSSSSSSSFSSPLTYVPLDTLVPPPSSLYASYISPSDLPSFHAPSPSSSQPTTGYGDYQGLSTLGDPAPVYRSVALSHPLDSYDSEANSHEFLSNFERITQFKKSVELPGSSLEPRIHINTERVDLCATGRPTPPSPPGGYLEPSTHFFIEEVSMDTLTTFLDIMKEKKVDTEVMIGLFLIKCEAYRDCARCEFNVRIFSVHDERGNFAVEVQRRFGDGMVFYQIYQEVKTQFEKRWRQKKGVDVSMSGPPSPPSPIKLSPLQCPPLDLPEMRCCRQVKCDVLKSLIQMVESDCVDVKANAITALAEMSTRPEMKEAMLSSGVVDIFIEHLCCSHPDVHRCALTGLANLIGCGRNTSTCETWMRSEKVKHRLCRLVKSACPQIVRECARSYALIAETLKEQVKDDECFRHCVEVLACSQDGQTREAALRAQESLNVVQ